MTLEAPVSRACGRIIRGVPLPPPRWVALGMVPDESVDGPAYLASDRILAA